MAAPAATPLWRHPAFLAPLALAILASPWIPDGLAGLAALFGDAEFAVAGWVPQGVADSAAWFALPLVGLGFGLLASFSPCVLPLVPLNLAAIGAAEATGRRAVALSARFSLGAALALAGLGLFGEAAGWLLIEQRGPVLLLAGVAMIGFAGMALELLPLPFAGRAPGAGRRLGPVATGAAFSLVTTPCASPLLGGVLAAAAARGIPGLSVATMLAFAFGYTALVFAAGAFGGGLVRRLSRRSFAAPRAAAAAALLLAGAAFVATGLSWF